MKYLIWLTAMLFIACGTAGPVSQPQVAQVEPISDEQIIDSLLSAEIATDELSDPELAIHEQEISDTDEVEFIIEED